MLQLIRIIKTRAHDIRGSIVLHRPAFKTTDNGLCPHGTAFGHADMPASYTHAAQKSSQKNWTQVFLSILPNSQL